MLFYSDTGVDEREDKGDVREAAIGPKEGSEHRCSNMQLWLNDSLYCKLVFSGTLQSGYKINPRDHEIINGTVPEKIMFTCTLFFKG